jgi:hypothetical protein
MTTDILRKTGIVLSIALGIILTSAAICLIISVIWPVYDLKIVSLISNNWLMIIFKSQANIINNHDSLLGINLYDIGIIVLFIFVCLALFVKFKYQNKVWFLIAISLLVLGIVIFIITHLAGRSAFMASGLIISVILFSKNSQSKLTGFTGIIASVLLLVGDFTAGAHIEIIPYLFGIGYFLQIIWIFMIARILILSGKNDIQI